MLASWYCFARSNGQNFNIFGVKSSVTSTSCRYGTPFLIDMQWVIEQSPSIPSWVFASFISHCTDKDQITLHVFDVLLTPPEQSGECCNCVLLLVVDQQSHFSPPYRMIKTLRKLGEGVFGEVYGCFTSEGDSLAVKASH